GHGLELPPRHLLRVADDAALGAAEWDPHERALPGHPHRQCLHLVEGDVGVVADTALRRPARDVVGDAIPLEGLRRPVVHPDWNGNLDRLLALAEYGDEVRIDGEGGADAAELLARQLEWILAQVGRRYDCCHLVAPFVAANKRKPGRRSELSAMGRRRGRGTADTEARRPSA